MARVLRVPLRGLREGYFELPEESARYVTRVHRRRVGDELLLFDPEERLEARATLVSERPAAVSCAPPVPATLAAVPLELVLCVGKGDKPDQVVRDVTELGVAALRFVWSERTVARASGDERLERLRRVAIEAARQAGRPDVPALLEPEALATWLARLAPPVGDSSGRAPRRLVAAFHPAARPLVEVAALLRQAEAEEEPVRVVVGPEGGLTDAEVAELVARGFVAVSLGPHTLRTETAATVAAGVLSLSLNGV